NHDHEPFQLQLADGFPHGRPADPQLLGQLDLHQPLARLEGAVDDGLPDGLKHQLPQRLVIVQLDGHQRPWHRTPLLPRSWSAAARSPRAAAGRAGPTGSYGQAWDWTTRHP